VVRRFHGRPGRIWFSDFYGLVARSAREDDGSLVVHADLADHARTAAWEGRLLATRG
jgi:hypothetical protein